MQAFKNLRRKLAFSLSVVSTMGITLGLLLCVITLNHLLLSEPLPYPEQDELYVAKYLKTDQSNTIVSDSFDYNALIEMYKNQAIFSSASVIHHSWNLIENHPSQPLVNTVATTPEYFELFDVPIIIGRGFEETEAIDLKNPVVVISYRLWQKHYGGKPDVIGQRTVLGDFSYKIIGVIAEDFIEPQLYEVGRTTDVWLPWDVIGAFLDDDYGIDYPISRFNLVGKINRKNDFQLAEQIESHRINDFWKSQTKYQTEEKKLTAKIKLISAKNAILGDSESIGLMLLAVAVGLILIASTNITNLFVSRLAVQQSQLSIRAAIGAKKSHLFFQIFSESLILMFAASVFALLFSSLGFEIMQEYFSTLLPRSDELKVSLITWIIAVCLLFIFALIFSVIGTRLINYCSLNSVLLASGKGVGFQVSRKIRYILITIQVSVATLLIFINLGLFQQATGPILKPKGINLDNIYKIYLTPHSHPFESAATRISLTKEVKRRLLELPTVESISHSHYPILPAGLIKKITTQSEHILNAYSRHIDHDYLALTGQKLLKGDNFVYADIQNRNRGLTGEIEKNFDKVVIVNQTFAEKLLYDTRKEVLGQLISINGGTPSRIIGIVEDSIITSSLTNEAVVYAPTTEAGFTYLIKFKQGQSLTRKQLVSLIKSVTSLYAPYEYGAVSDDMDKLLFAHTTVAIVTSILGVVVLFFAGLGIYGVLSYSIQMRRFEIGIRLAIGAKRRSLIGLMIRDNATPILIGVTLSLVGLLMLYLGFREQLAEYLAVQLANVFGITALLVGALLLLACYLPLRRYINRPVMCSLRG